jgi:uncharacterized protein YndB with AHSA1/START domain
VSKEKAIQRTLHVNNSALKAFEVFTENMSDWWPRDYTWCREVLEEIGMENEEGGLCYEIGPHNFRLDWGRVIEYDPPARLRFTWQISPLRLPEPDPAKASEIEINFIEEDELRTRLEFSHKKFENHGKGGDKYREIMDSPEGWDYILICYSEFLSSK